ncbi:hypothetical protein EV360DRAFT_95809 [Lentinula raphanica]|nr:hypothetical protein EV360DRAFT_95809 [Lentinula raphanica]
MTTSNGSTATNVPAPATSTANTMASSAAPSNGPLVATGDWTRDLVHLAKTAELKKHALTLQLHTAHILSAHAALEQKGKSIQDVREQKNKLDSERNRLIAALRQVNDDRDQADMLEGNLERECATLRSQITTLSDGEYAVAKADVDRLRVELGQPPLPSLQTMLDEKAANFLTERRLNGSARVVVFRPASASLDPSLGEMVASVPAKRPRGRPKGSKTQKRTGT